MIDKFKNSKYSTIVTISIFVSVMLLVYSEYNKSEKTTMESVKVVSADLQSKGDFKYLSGYMIEEPFKLKDSYSYNVTYPSEIFDGYVTKVKSTEGGVYYIWSKYKTPFIKDIKIEGYFLTCSLSKFDDGSDILEILYPIVDKNWSLEIN